MTVPPEPRVTTVTIMCPHPACYCNATLRVEENWDRDSALELVAAIKFSLSGHVNPLEVPVESLPEAR